MMPLDCFYADYAAYGGHKSVCAECCRAKDKAKRQEPKDVVGAYTSRIHNARQDWRRAGKRVESFSAQDVIKAVRRKFKAEPDRCLITGQQLQWDNPHDRVTFLNLDHVRGVNSPRSRHSKNNLAPMSAVVNQDYKREGSLLEAWKRTPTGLQAMCYAGIADGMAGVDENGNPLIPARAEWREGDSEPITVFVPVDED